jgi:hypothetical protein
LLRFILNVMLKSGIRISLNIIFLNLWLFKYLNLVKIFYKIINLKDIHIKILAFNEKFPLLHPLEIFCLKIVILPYIVCFTKIKCIFLKWQSREYEFKIHFYKNFENTRFLNFLGRFKMVNSFLTTYLNDLKNIYT